MKKILAVLVALALPTIASAATYQYVDTTGTVRSVEASSESEAFLRADNIALHSGVIREADELEGDFVALGTSATASFAVGGIGGYTVGGFGVGGIEGSMSISDRDLDGDGQVTYQYVNGGGAVAETEADDAVEALLTAPAIAEHSGVMYAENEATDLPEGMRVPL